MRISEQRRTMRIWRISVEYSPGRAGVAVYGQRYGGTIKPTSPEACSIPYNFRVSTACFVDEYTVCFVKCACIDKSFSV